MTNTIATHPRAAVLALVVAGLLLGLVAGTTFLSARSASADGHVSGLETIVVGDVVVDYNIDRGRDSTTQVRIWGSGFAPGQEVLLLVNDGPGTPNDIGNYSTNTSPDNTMVANDRGAWTTVWTLGRFTRTRGGVGPGDGDVERVRSLTAVDPSTFDAIASTPLSFCRVTARVNAQAALVTLGEELAALQAKSDAGLPAKPINVSDAAWALATAFYPDVQAQLDAEIAAKEAQIEATTAQTAVPSTCPA